MTQRLADEGGNLSLSEGDLARFKPLTTHGGQRIRALCPFHGSDHQRSLSLDKSTGRFHCFACGAWGYTVEARERWKQEKAGTQWVNRPSITTRAEIRPIPRQRTPPLPQPSPQVSRDLTPQLKIYQAALPGSLGERYLVQRGIQLDVAQALGLGYAPPGKWAHKGRDWKAGRLVFPHTDLDGRLVNLYGRAIELTPVPKALRHDHLPGFKGYFNAQVIRDGSGPLFVCEGPFDALSLIAAGHLRTAAIFGVHGWRWDWVRQARDIVFAFDADEAGETWRAIARHLVVLGKRVAVLGVAEYGGHKDVSEAWAAGALRVGEWPFPSQQQA